MKQIFIEIFAGEYKIVSNKTHQRLWIILLTGINLMWFSCRGTPNTDSAAREIKRPLLKNLKDLRAAREKAKHRRRRIIMNNDGNDFRMLHQENLKHPEKFLQRRTIGLENSQVDSIFYCTGVFNQYTNPMDECEIRVVPRYYKPELMQLLKQRNIDSLKIMIDFCRRHDKEIFWSMRMNDTHDSSPKLRDQFSQWKRDHLKYLVCPEKERTQMKYGARRWSAVDYNIPEVRDKVYRIFTEICHRYDVDGIELDFFRHLIIFKEQINGIPITQTQCDKFTEMLRRIRRMTEREGLRRGKPMLIAVRVPDSVGYCRALGLDLEQWLKDGLIDIVTGGGYFKLEPWKNLVALGKTYDVPVYACLVKRRIESEAIVLGNSSKVKIWRGEAYKAWQAGVDGIYTFNIFDPKDAVFYELGDLELLKRLDRIDQTFYINENLGASRPETWLKDGRKYLQQN